MKFELRQGIENYYQVPKVCCLIEGRGKGPWTGSGTVLGGNADGHRAAQGCPQRRPWQSKAARGGGRDSGQRAWGSRTTSVAQVSMDNLFFVKRSKPPYADRYRQQYFIVLANTRYMVRKTVVADGKSNMKQKGVEYHQTCIKHHTNLISGAYSYIFRASCFVVEGGQPRARVRYPRDTTCTSCDYIFLIFRVDLLIALDNTPWVSSVGYYTSLSHARSRRSPSIFSNTMYYAMSRATSTGTTNIY